MVRRFLGFDRYLGLMTIGVALIFLAGCAKKVPPVSGGTGLSAGDGASSDSGFPSDDSMSGGGGLGDSDDVTSMNQDRSKGGSSGDSSGGASGGSSDDAVAKGSQGGSGMGGDQAVFAQAVYFDFDKADVRNDAKTVLSENARWLALNPEVKVQIEGHGDERGTNEYNLALGERRARTVLRYLVNLGINESRFSFISYGEEKGVCSEQNEDCYQKNRRAFFQVKE